MIFYAPNIAGDHVTLSEEESKHAVKALRLKTGDPLSIVDGRGGRYEATLVEPDRRHCVVAITGERHEAARSFRLHIAIAPTKNIDRFEWFVEKAIEIGIDEITPVCCEHSERRTIPDERIGRIAVAAMKQSSGALLPAIHPLTPFGEWLRSCSLPCKLIAYCGSSDRQTLKTVSLPATDTAIAIGPEGDFSEAEVKLALSLGFNGITLGTNRLRTETAGIVVCSCLNFINS